FGQLIDHKSNIMQHNRIRRSRTESQPRKTRSYSALNDSTHADPIGYNDPEQLPDTHHREPPPEKRPSDLS
ncbi:hypothetical protein, partial [Nocardia sp. NPDC051570]|uniref:hypothetical protein n=1 Tax=Nocardia sp. NPDC051570 TaxID=3364324 RepID=UPI0037B3F563